MATLTVMTARLGQIWNQLSQSPVVLTGRPQEAKQAEQEALRLEKMSEELRLITRDLKSSASLIELQKGALPRNLPRDQRWQAAQSLARRGENVQAALEKAEGLARWLHDLLKRNGIVSPMQMGKELTDLLENFEKTAENIAAAHEGIQQVTAGPAYLPAHSSPAGGVPAVHTLVPLVTFAYLATKWLAKKRRGQ